MANFFLCIFLLPLKKELNERGNNKVRKAPGNIMGINTVIDVIFFYDAEFFDFKNIT
jgi:hypothetical protein